MSNSRRVEPLTAEEEARYRRHMDDEPYLLPDRINTIQHLVRRLFATIDRERENNNRTTSDVLRAPFSDRQAASEAWRDD